MNRHLNFAKINLFNKNTAFTIHRLVSNRERSRIGSGFTRQHSFRISGGFTIVELLVVIVVIGILSTLAFISYGNISNQAMGANVQSDLSGAARMLKLYQAEHGSYPTAFNETTYCPTLPEPDDNYCLKSSDQVSFQNYDSDGYSFSLEGTYGTTGVFYRITDGASPIVVAEGWKQISGGFAHTCAIGYDDHVYCWGFNSVGQIGNDTSGTNYLTPTAVSTSAGDMGDQVVQFVAAGNHHTCVIAADNKVYCWGLNNYGQLGDDSSDNRLVPTAVSTTVGDMGGQIVLSIASGYENTCAIAVNSRAYCWGLNSRGQVGDDTTDVRLVPTAVSTTSGDMGDQDVQSIAAGYDFACAIAADNRAYCWGANASGQIGDDTSGINRLVPTAVSTTSGDMGDQDVQSITAGHDHTCAVAANSRAYCWGSNGSKQIGDYTTALKRLVPTAVSTAVGDMGNQAVQSITAGYAHTCVLVASSQAYCWGLNTYGQIGDNTTISHSAPAAVSTIVGDMGDQVIKLISSGQFHTCAIAADDQAYCWGRNDYGQIGDDTSGVSRLTSVSVNISTLW